MSAWKIVLQLFIRFLIYSLIVIMIDFVLIFVIMGGINQIKSVLSFVLLSEGGIGLIAGGATALYSPSVAKITEVLFHSKPWNFKRQKETEKQAKELILMGILLIFEALLLSAV